MSTETLARLSEDNIAELEEILALSTRGEFHWGTHFSGSHEEATAWFAECLAWNAATDVHLVTVGDPTIKHASKVVALTGNGPNATRHAYLIAVLLTVAPAMLAEIKEYRATQQQDAA